MYIFFGIFILICIFFAVFFHRRRKRIIQKIRNMSPCAQKKLLDELMQPFGFLSCPQQNIITSDIDSWQRTFGYKSASTVPIQFCHRTGLPMPALKAFPIPSCCRCPCSFFIKADHCFASDRPTGGWRASVRDFLPIHRICHCAFPSPF